MSGPLSLNSSIAHHASRITVLIVNVSNPSDVAPQPSSSNLLDSSSSSPHWPSPSSSSLLSPNTATASFPPSSTSSTGSSISSSFTTLVSKGITQAVKDVISEGTDQSSTFNAQQSTSTPSSSPYSSWYDHIGPQSPSLSANRPVTPEEYYADYDPMLGVRIGVSLLAIILFFAFFLTYKGHCNAKRAKRILAYTNSESARRRATSICE
ncbi:uncharacterized protein LOC141855371 [Brevipalpus obovatus]|uniref:uncharacterized protein LOC141855371 n=1 Tax=Brevipalpus obovatus TaxID=246614 RepID=UPI003D9F7571